MASYGIPVANSLLCIFLFQTCSMAEYILTAFMETALEAEKIFLADRLA